MPKIGSLDELRKLRASAQRDMAIRRNTGTKITVGMGTCGIAAGARDTLQAILKELDARQIEANVATVGCIGMCSKEPLVDIEQMGKPRVTYANVHPDMVPRLIEEHLVNGHVVQEWVFARVSGDGVAVPDSEIS